MRNSRLPRFSLCKRSKQWGHSNRKTEDSYKEVGSWEPLSPSTGLSASSCRLHVQFVFRHLVGLGRQNISVLRILTALANVWTQLSLNENGEDISTEY